MARGFIGAIDFLVDSAPSPESGGAVDEQRVTIKFDGKSHQVDLATFTNVLMDYSAVVMAAARQVGVVEPVKIYIAATEPGSLDAIVSIVANAAGSLLGFLESQGPGISAAINTASGLYGLKQKIAGKKEVTKEGENRDSNQVTLKVDGDLIVVNGDVYGLYKNHPEATAAIDRSFMSLDENPEISSIKMTTGGEELFFAERGEFSGIASSLNYEGPDVRHTTEDAVLLVTKPYLAVSKTRKWEFVYRGEKITACIHDESFLNSLSEYSFSMGTEMTVKLDIMQVMDETCGAYLNKGFTVLEVVDVAPAPKTQSLF